FGGGMQVQGLGPAAAFGQVVRGEGEQVRIADGGGRQGRGFYLEHTPRAEELADTSDDPCPLAQVAQRGGGSPVIHGILRGEGAQVRVAGGGGRQGRGLYLERTPRAEELAGTSDDPCPLAQVAQRGGGLPVIHGILRGEGSALRCKGYRKGCPQNANRGLSPGLPYCIRPGPDQTRPT